MANKTLTPAEVEQLKELALKGTAPQDIASFFGIGIASVHNWKNKLKDMGLEIPNVRGLRPKGEIDGVILPSKTDSAGDSSRTFNTTDGDIQFLINGRSVIVTGPVKNIKITPEGLEVNY